MHKLPDNFEALLEQRTQELKASEERFRNIIERNADGIVIMDRNGIVRFVNPAAEKLFNRKAKDFQGETLGFPVLAGETTEINIIRENKEPVLAEIRVVETEWEGRAVWLASLRDITERKEAEEALQAAEESFHAIVEKSPNGSIVVNREGIVQYVNPSGEILLNRKADELIDTMFGLPVTSDTITTELEILRKGGGTGIAECLVVDTEWRREDAYLITLHDITERKEAEETLIKANEQLKKLDQMKSEFVSVASHELRTPLTSIKNSVDLVLSGKTGEITEAQERFLSMAERNIGRLSILINDLLDISRIEAGKIDLNTTAIDLNNSFKQVVRSLNTLANTKDISLKINSPHNLPEIYGDTIRIEQVLTNFVGNAIKFTPERGTVTINARQVKEAPDKSEGRGGFIEVSVTDTGVGIPEEHIEHIFEKFYQVDSSLARHQQSDSTGLGLAICKGIVEAHGGRVWCKSREGEGSTFFFTLPMFNKEDEHFLHLINEVSKTRQQNAPLSVVVVTIKDLENDMNIYGEGGRVTILETDKERINEAGIKKTDRIYVSYAEGELILALPDTDKKGALTVKKRLEEQIAGKEIVIGDGTYTPSLTIGIATFPEDGTSAEELVKTAREGKNQLP